MFKWPSSFPAPTQSFSGSESPNAIRTTMDSGAVRQRRRFMTEQCSVKVDWQMSDEIFAIFVAFHKHKINLGTDWFLMDLPIGGGFLEHVVRFQDGKFDQSYEEHAHWRVQAILEVQQRVTIDEGVLDLYLTVGFSEIEQNALLLAVDNLHVLVHETMPFNLN